LFGFCQPICIHQCFDPYYCKISIVKTFDQLSRSVIVSTNFFYYFKILLSTGLATKSFFLQGYPQNLSFLQGTHKIFPFYRITHKIFPFHRITHKILLSTGLTTKSFLSTGLTTKSFLSTGLTTKSYFYRVNHKSFLQS